MSGVRFELQKEVFESSRERLHGVVGVKKLRQKKRDFSYLCLTGTIERPTRFNIYLIKKTEKGFKRKQDWTVSTLKEANFKAKDSLEFDLHLEKPYQWIAEGIKEKEVFFTFLNQICSRLQRPPKVLNFQSIEDEGEDGGNNIAAIVSVPKDGQFEESDEEEFGLTEKEEIDLEKVLGRMENAVVNAEAFMEQLGKELSILDGENIHSIMESETQVNALMNSIDVSISELDGLDTELQIYEEAVTHVKNAVEKIEEENSQIGTAAKNNQLLLTELTNLVEAIDFPHSSVLLNADLTSQDGIQKAAKAAFQLKEALNMQEKVHPALLKLQAVIEQKKRLESTTRKFSQNTTSHLAKLFIHFGNSFLSMDKTGLNQVFRLQNLGKMHEELLRYIELTSWLKAMDPEAFVSLLKTYTIAIQKIYEKNVRTLFEEARFRISGTKLTSTLSGSSGDLRIRGRYFGKTRSLANREGDTESQGSGEGSVDSSERQHFYDVLDQLLDGIEPEVNAEEGFITRFFHIETAFVNNPISPSISPTRGSGGELRRLMNILFGVVEAELTAFLTQFEKMEASFCMGAMVRLGKHALKSENTSTYIGLTFGSVLIQEKRSFDRLMNSYIQFISDNRLPRKVKPGILAFVIEFEEFALNAETIFEGSARRSDLEKWYVRILTTIFDGINRLSTEGSKTPGEVIRMENFHRLHAILSQLKVAAMDQQKRDAKIKYTEALNAYVTKYFGRPLIKLNEFFEGVQVKVSQGVKESEIGYQMAFSRVELKRVIKEYPVKEVKKGLESLYRKVEKHLSEEENLLQVVWRAMQEEFIVQYKSIESLIGRCYPGAKITLEFTIQDILIFFSEIAQSH